MCGTVGGNNNTVAIISNCSNRGIVNDIADKTTYNIGGVCGIINDNATIINCFNSGKVNTQNCTYVGGVCGFFPQKNVNATIANCYNAGSVSGTNDVGGVCGYYNSSENRIIHCYYSSSDQNLSAIGSNSGIMQDAFKPEAAFHSGEVAYLLAQGCTIGEQTYDGSIWGQDLSDENSYPELGASKVYLFGNAYTNLTEPKQVDGVYQISNAAELYWFAGLVNGTLDGVEQNTSANAIVIADITVNENVLAEDGTLNSGTFTPWTPIGNSSNRYTGTFNGDGKTISGLYFDDTSTSYVGLFGCLGENGNITGVTVADSYFSGLYYVGGVCGFNDSGTITNCSNTGAVSGSYHVGGVCGWNDFGTIANCYFLKSDSLNIGLDAIGLSYDTPDKVESKTETQFHSGEVAYLLAQGCTLNAGTDDEKFYDGSIWGQDLSDESSYPALNQMTVYRSEPCPTYSNTKPQEEVEHIFEGGVRTVCGINEGTLTASEDDIYPTDYVYNPDGAPIATPTTGTPVPLATPTTDNFKTNNTDADAEMTFEWYADADLTQKLDEIPTAAGTYYLLISIPQTENFSEASLTLVIDVAKATSVVTPMIPAGAYFEGDLIPEIQLGDDDTEGSIKWLDVQHEQRLEAGKNVFSWEFMPTDENYTVVTGTIVIEAGTTTTTTTTTITSSASDSKTTTSAIPETSSTSTSVTTTAGHATTTSTSTSVATTSTHAVTSTSINTTTTNTTTTSTANVTTSDTTSIFTASTTTSKSSVTTTDTATTTTTVTTAGVTTPSTTTSIGTETVLTTVSDSSTTVITTPTTAGVTTPVTTTTPTTAASTATAESQETSSATNTSSPTITTAITTTLTTAGVTTPPATTSITVTSIDTETKFSDSSTIMTTTLTTTGVTTPFATTETTVQTTTTEETDYTATTATFSTANTTTSISTTDISTTTTSTSLTTPDHSTTEVSMTTSVTASTTTVTTVFTIPTTIDATTQTTMSDTTTQTTTTAFTSTRPTTDVTITTTLEMTTTSITTSVVITDPTAPVVTGVRGDANLDGIVNIHDAFSALTYYCNQMAGNTDYQLHEDAQLNDIAISQVDINRDGKIAMLDAFTILIYYCNHSAGIDMTWEEALQLWL